MAANISLENFLQRIPMSAANPMGTWEREAYMF